MNESLKILYGTYSIRDTPEHRVADLSVKGIYEYPYQLESGPTILGVDLNGTIRMSYNNESFYLYNQSEWESPVTTGDIETINHTTWYYKLRFFTFHVVL